MDANLNSPDGCKHHPRCLTCPLPVCIYDVPGGFSEVMRLRESIAQRRQWSLMREAVETLPLKIIREVAEAHGITPAELVSKGRHKHLFLARREAAQRMRAEIEGIPLKAIGLHLGGRDHTTVLYMLNGKRR